MPIDGSIYQNVQAPQINIPSPLDMAQKSMQLSQLGMQQMQMARQMRMQSAMQDAYMRNTDPNTGQVDQGGVLSSLGKSGDVMAQQQAASAFASQNKATAEAKAAQLDAQQKTLSLTGPAFDYMAKMPEDQRAAAYPGVIQQLKDQGVDTSRMDHPYDPGLFQQYYGAWQNGKPALENALTQAQTGKAISETAQVGMNRQTDYQKLLLNDDRYKESTGVLAQGNSALAAVDDAIKNPQSRTELPIILARFSTGGKKMSNVEVEKGAAAGDFGDKIQQMYNDSKAGVLTPQMADYAKQYITSQMAPAAQNKLAVENDVAGKYAVDAGLTQKDAYARLTSQAPGTLAQTPAGPSRFTAGPLAGGVPGVSNASAADNATSAPPPNSLKMSDGKRTKWIPAGKKGAAIADGWSVVK